METNRLFLAFLISTLILIIWNTFFSSPPVPENRALNPELTEPSLITKSQVRVLEEDSNLVVPRKEQAPETTIAAVTEMELVLENDRVRLEFTNRGAQLRSVLLFDYNASGDQRALEMVRLRGSDPHPFGLITAEKRSHKLNDALFVGEVDDEAKEIHFVHSSESGSAKKTFKLTEDGFLDVVISVSREADWSFVVGPGVRELTTEEEEDRYLQKQIGFKTDLEVGVIPASDLSSEEIISGEDLLWVSLEDNFFLIGVVPVEGLKEVLVRPVSVRRDPPTETEPRFLEFDPERQKDLARDQLVLVRAGAEEFQGLLFFGAKRYKKLVELPYSLEDTVRWGWFGFLVKPLYFGLEWITENVTSNYGWAIILITCILRILFFPLTYKSQKSMAKMQELNPEIQAIKKRYRPKLKNRQGRPNMDAQRQMNEEIMEIYRKSGVNPASGCLPILLQMPVFFAFFRLLTTNVELRHAPWIGWIEDLSKADPYWILPILMGITSVLMQRLMPTTPDPMQRRIMQAMPLFFMVFAFYMPSGLVLYWVMNNILSMVQQLGMNKLRNR